MPPAATTFRTFRVSENPKLAGYCRFRASESPKLGTFYAKMKSEAPNEPRIGPKTDLESKMSLGLRQKRV